MLIRLEVPEEFNRNTANITALGAEHTGQKLIEYAMERTGRVSLANVDVLDIGCGVRFTQTLINRAIPIRSYTGIEVDLPIVNFLKESVESRDRRFSFVHWDIRNELYNPSGEISLPKLERLPIDGEYDLIWLFSVFTHLNLQDAEAMLRILRSHVRPSGSLFFSAFIDPRLTGFEDRVPETPLLKAYFGLRAMNEMLEQTGWAVDSFCKMDYRLPIQERENQLPIVDNFTCKPRQDALDLEHEFALE